MSALSFLASLAMLGMVISRIQARPRRCLSRTAT
jgi:hypothetical protein